MKPQSIHNSMVEEFRLVERWYSRDAEKISIGIANISAKVPDIETNKDKIIRVIKIFKQRRVNMILFPEFCLGGYFWDDEAACWAYMDQVATDNHLDWINHSVAPLLDDELAYIILNNIRKNPKGGRKFLNTTYVLRPGSDIFDNRLTYDKSFLPGIEKTFTVSGLDDRLILDSRWGRFGFCTCYDFCFPRLLLECAIFDEPDAIIVNSSWRGSGFRNYPQMNVKTDHYYGFLWDILMPAMAATHQSWVISCNAVGEHAISGAKFWGGSGVWAPSGMALIRGSCRDEELIIVHHMDIIGERKFEKADFDYAADFKKIYRMMEGKRAFTRIACRSD